MATKKNVLTTGLLTLALVGGCKQTTSAPSARPEAPSEQREPRPSAVPDAVQTDASDRWYDFSFKGNKIGYLHATEREVELDGQPALHVTRASVMMVGRREQDIRIESNVQSWCRPDGTPIRFLHVRSEGDQERALEGRVADGAFEVTMNVGGQITKERHPLEGLALSSTLDVIHYDDLSEGAKFEGSALSESEGDVQPYRLEVVEKRPEGFVVDELQAGIRSRSIVSPDGHILETEIPMMGARFERTTRKRALEFGARVDVFSQALFALPRPLPPGRALSSVTLQLSTRSGARPSIIEDERQRVEWRGDVALLTVTELPPPDVSATIPVSDPEFAEYLRPTPYEKLDDPVLISASRAAVGDAKDVMTAVRRLVPLVNTHIEEKNLSQAFTSASEAWARKVGDCTEHSVLFSALAKIAGVPTRLVTGLVYVGGARNQFGYHEWAEVWTGSGWHPVDPTFGQTTADPTHLEFAVGQSDPASLREAGVVAASLIGDLELELVSSTEK